MDWMNLRHWHPCLSLAGFVTDLKVQTLSTDLSRFVEGRLLDDNARVLTRCESGARGLLLSSQIALGNSNGVRIRVYGAKGGLSWFQERPDADHKTRSGLREGARVGVRWAVPHWGRPKPFPPATTSRRRCP
jgi:predicted dehydrogenase